jgi:hypothetical protein
MAKLAFHLGLAIDRCFRRALHRAATEALGTFPPSTVAVTQIPTSRAIPKRSHGSPFRVQEKLWIAILTTLHGFVDHTTTLRKRRRPVRSTPPLLVTAPPMLTSR